MLYDDFAILLKHKYELFLFALTGQYLAVVRPGFQATPNAITTFQKNASMSRETFLAEIEQCVTDYANKYSSDVARVDAKKITADISRVTLANIQMLILQMKGAGQVAIESIKGFAGAMGLLLQERVAKPDFKATGVSGRTYKAIPYVEAQARQFAYMAWIEKVLNNIAQTSDIAKVEYPDPSHENNGLLFSISGSSEAFPSFESIKARIFHYNSTAMVTSHV